ncbi:E4 SUMO-protein ligase PIAL2-like isoform X4, partial [Fagus crenata]
MQCLTSSFMVGRVAESLYMHIHSGQPSDPSVLSDLCFALARGIDHAVANNEVPPKVQDLPVLVKQVYKHINDCSPQAAVMALMISVKNACMIGWFQIEDAVDLLIMAEEDTGPQLPTNITAMLKDGINLFQVVGQFNGNYHIVIAFMSVMSSSSETPVLQDYVLPVVASLNS